MHEDDVIIKMNQYIDAWKASGDSRHVFLSCYHMMSQNMLKALENGEFSDAKWVNKLLNRFADYYFESLVCFDCGEQTPAVWQHTHGCCKNDQMGELQLLVLGVNAHINYDLVLALYDMLSPEWEKLGPEKRRERYQDHSYVNEVIGQTIDRVQDELLEPSNPSLDWIDKLLGRVDEYLISKLISSWREEVWENSQRLLTMESPQEREKFRKTLEQDVLRKADIIGYF